MVYYIHTYNKIPRQNETRSKDEHFYNIKPDVSINVPFYAVGYAHRPKEIRTDKVYALRVDKCRFIGYAIDVNWSNTSKISKVNESNFVNYYKNSYIVMIDGKRYIRHDVVFKLYQNQPTILKVEPADRDPSNLKQDSNYTNEEYLKEFDHQLSQPLRDPHSIFSKSA